MKLGYLLAGVLAAVGCGSDSNSDGVLGASSDGGRSNLGKKYDGGPATTGTCGSHNVIGDNAIPDMLIVLDRSSSMSPAGNANHTDRWAGSARAVQEVTAKYSAGVDFGLMTFPGTGGGGGGGSLSDLINGALGANCTPGTVNVPIGTDQGPAINQAIAGMRPNGYTPTAATLTAAAQIIGSPEYSDQHAQSNKYVLLVTDGDPNCSPGWSPRGQSDVDPQARADTIAAVEALTKQGVKTYVVGYETAGTAFAGALDMMAAAGGTGETMHRSVESADDLVATFDELAAKATTCSYSLSESVDPTYVSVTVGTTQRKYNNKADGWTLSSDKKTVTLSGKACDDAKSGQGFIVKVECTPVYYQ